MKLLLATATAALMALSIGSAFSADLAPLNSDTEKDRIDWSQVEAKFGAFPKLPEGTKAGAVSKTLTNEYWRSLGEGYTAFGAKVGVPVVYQAAQSEGDQLGQLTIAEGLVTQGYNVLLVSPQTDANLQPIMEQAKAANVPVVNVNDAVIPQAEHYVGNVQRDNGVRVAKWFIKNRPNGGKVAIVEGQAGVYAAVQRTDGFKSTIIEGGKFEVVASVPGNWDRQTSYDAATNILQQHPDLIGFYANNDGMALGIVEAVKAAGLQDKVAVFGTDGISDAYASIRAGELTGTVDSFPVLTGEVALETALRLVAGQKLPRVVATPQALITKDNADRYSGADARKALLEDAAAGR
ncbi:substrate-binding domain-containing protein [Mesorhizobium sp. M7A.F.Ca.MR.245.00.0.0]|uniref:sugar ABC transporter substrate-binding protein n=1 Tax=Mesorhizobium sp. M7A.F.Ca.MR.245.00.0.0 TaxID=2496778 RepID=UPI000FC9BEDD|nr:substrate-binding domain-containing protein [Mesorhizobium sp. M7A.F.Ca.MR.245.00.0.0]RUV17287.1 ABC transporter substrate-binding protein [Mesorhizobium sp. M7A.F.Ca.MR.245.00.0.0]RUV52079.1 ABC transporter substrate-binding protein [Mesorhizobium sp. M7A.F.Ca.MR.228.00.0.0]